MKTIILNTTNKSKLILLGIFVFLLNFDSFSKSNFLISKTTYKTVRAFSQDSHSQIDYLNFEDDSEVPENQLLIDLCDSDIDVFSLNNKCTFIESIVFISLFKQFSKPDYQFSKIDVCLQPPRH